ncbi:MAG: hypothetical protein PHQ43_01005, partial [Dehalococcoidales bacterium]|nr:hypothetical protein [Dehalococcoidales bacterium]
MAIAIRHIPLEAHITCTAILKAVWPVGEHVHTFQTAAKYMSHGVSPLRIVSLCAASTFPRITGHFPY